MNNNDPPQNPPPNDAPADPPIPNQPPVAHPPQAPPPAVHPPNHPPPYPAAGQRPAAVDTPDRRHNRRHRDHPPHHAVPAIQPNEAERNRHIAAIIGAVSNQIHDDDRLRPDGSNFATWQDFIDERIRDAINEPLFFHFPNANPVNERIGRSLLLTSVDRSIRRGLARHATAHHMWQDIRVRFHSVSRAAQLDFFRRLMAFDVSSHPTTADIASHIGDILDEMETIWMPFTRDHLAGLVLQNGLASEPDLQTEFDRRVEQDLQTSTPQDPPMTFEQMIRLIDMIRRQNRLQNTVRAPAQRSTPLALQAEVTPPQQSTHVNNPPPFIPAQHPDNTPDAHDFMAMQVGLCWQCRAPDHMLRDCPMRARRPASNRSALRQTTNQPRIPSQTPSYAPQGFQLFYPIVTPPGFTGVYPQTQHPRQHQPQPLNSPSLASQSRPADYYRPPQYRNQRPSPQTESIGSQRPRPSANEAEANNSPLEESSARMVELGDVAEDLANVRFDHIQANPEADAPIVDSVATSGSPAYITGEGDLTFSGLDNQQVTIHGVLY
ncbi:hypothetical protein PGT21_050002 [Puccinia graminis f. sp. tritici]|uniref:CCHC-type domain-containing protein n=1 Tax=Puccinia graminis f. sp. tritici TaxID=56615 RepID=A0A5B0PHK3_PUCGR|nr:hypothetical protein PGTUg99_050089 [Puccinia graminis f. sp. tritici]KAA1099319.1 hypothetical protein PGT21_050002 [Puccinia graminis f. sp. tritici]